MREILFRGKCGSKWHYGDLYTQSNMPQIIAYNKKYDKMDTAFVDPETVGQYTGLTDKNGVKIFEGDILSRDNIRGYVSYSDELCRFVFRWKSYDKYRHDFFKKCALADFAGIHLVKVIGNIHDNPELLKEGGEE